MSAPWFLAVPPLLVLIAFPSLALYVGAVGALVVIAALSAAAYRFREERDLYRERAELLERECDAHAAENARLTGAQVIPLRWTHVPDLTIVPPQRDGVHDALPVADYPFPVHTAVDDDDIEALMRATEEQ
jgi:hypothetical protein